MSRRLSALIVLIILSLACNLGTQPTTESTPSQPTADTLAPPATAMPYLVRPQSRIVYTSLVGHGFDIFTMNADGSDVRRLTTAISSVATPQSYSSDWSPDGSQIVFSSNGVAELDLHQLFIMNADGSGLRQLTQPPMWVANDPAWSPDGAQIAFFGQLENQATRLYIMDPDDPANPRPVDGVGGGILYSPEWSPDGRQIAYIYSPDGGIMSLMSINLADGKKTTLVGDISHENGISWSPDGQWIAFTDYSDDIKSRYSDTDIVLYSVPTGETQRLTGLESLDRTPAWSPDGRWIAFERRGPENLDVYDIYAIHPDKTGLTRLTYHGSYDYQPDWGPLPPGASQVEITVPDITFASADATQFLNVRRGDILPAVLASGPAGSLQNPAWSPDGLTLAFDADLDGSGRAIYLLPPGATSPTRLSPDLGLQPSWSPDGSQLAYTLPGAGGGRNIAAVGVDGSQTRLLTNLAPPAEAYCPAWAPDGMWIAYLGKDTRGEYSLNLMRPDGSGSESISPGKVSLSVKGEGGCPSWSPDSHLLAYVSGSADFPGSIAYVSPDGTNYASVTVGYRDESEPAWSPDGTFILYQQRESPESLPTLWLTLAADRFKEQEWVPIDLSEHFGLPGMQPAWSPARLVP